MSKTYQTGTPQELSEQEMIRIEGGGFWVPFMAIGAAAASAVAIYDAGKATGEFIFQITH
ncbi:class IIb bacteriocin, lactobin A/cerein 7B family [Maribacter sp. 2307ULW6-5]|uniref:class IIb bacteriocin, lactobin A/cerein 7B family n=1 Tax=Maribacter sp. 2307ULW6-5 TaxID=3386275 RepID=UPI0039BD886E